MSYLVLGVALLAGLLLAAKWFVDADPKSVVRALKWLLFGVIGAVALFFLLTGRAAWAIAVLPAVIPYLMRIRALARTAKAFSRMRRGAAGQSSDVETATLRASLDHASGRMTGEVVAGRFAGRRIEAMELSELLALLDDCRRDDAESARILEAFLDRQHPSWRSAGGGAAGGENAARPGGDMDRAEALQVLGLEEGASEAEIKAAHHRLISNLHPDAGGSTYLAAKINRAKDVLLGR